MGVRTRTRRGRIRIGAAGGALIIFAWVLTTALLANAAWARADSITDLSLSSFGNGNLREQLVDARGSVRRARWAAMPIIGAGKVVGWIPWLGNEATAPEKLLNRASRDIEAVLSVLDALDATSSDLQEAAAAATSAQFSAAAEPLDRVAATFGQASSQFLAEFEPAGSTNYWFFISARADRKLDSAEALLHPAIGLVADASNVASHISGAIHAGGCGLDAEPSNVDCNTDLDEMLTHGALVFRGLNNAAGNLRTLAIAAPLDAGQKPAIEGFVPLLEEASMAGEIAIEELQNILKCESGGLLDEGCGTGKMLAALGGSAGVLPAVLEVARYTEEVVGPVFASTGLPGASTVLELAGSVSQKVASANEAVTIVSGLAGVYGQESLLVLGMSPDELRPNGGFISSVWSTEFEAGALKSMIYIDVLEFDEQLQPAALEPAPTGLLQHMNAGALYMRDASWFPHFPVSAGKALSIAEGAGFGSYEHVIGLNLWFVARLADGVGGLEVDGVLLDQDGVIRAIEEGTDAEGREFLATIVPALLHRLSGPAISENPARLLRTLMSAMDEKDAVIYSMDQEVQGAAERLGWAGALPNDRNDRVAIFDSNVGWNKSDRLVERSFSYSVVLDPLAVSTARLRLEYTLSQSEGYECPEQSAVSTNYSYELLMARCNWNHVRAYIANGATVEGHAEASAPGDAIAVRNGSLTEGADTFLSGFDDDGTFASALLKVETLAPADLEIEYRLPSHIVNETAPGEYEYRLLLVVQPGARGRTGSVRIELPQWATNISATPGNVDGTVIHFETGLLRDEELVIRFAGQ